MSSSGHHLTLTMWIPIMLTYLNVQLGGVKVKQEGHLSIFGQGWCKVNKWPASSCGQMLGCWNGKVSRWYQRFGGCTCSLAEEKAAWWDNYGQVWMYWNRQGHLFALSAYINRIQVRYTPLSPIFHLILYAHRAEIVRWVSENKQPFKIMTDHGFHSLMKTGQPEYHIPSAETISHDVRYAFVNVCKCIAKMLQVCTIRYPFCNK